MELDEILERRENEIKDTINNIVKHLDCSGILLLVFNPLESFGLLLPGDFEKNILPFISETNMKQAIVLLHGAGGNFEEGLYLAHYLRQRFKLFKIIVPSLCCSALCLPILSSDQLIMLRNAKITQIDPVIENNGEDIRAIEHIHDIKNPQLKERSRKVFDYASRRIFELLKAEKSLFDHERCDFESCDYDNFISAFLYKDGHDGEVSPSDFKTLPLKVEYNDDLLLKVMCRQLIQQIQNYLIDTKQRYCLASSEVGILRDKITKKEFTGSLLFCP